MLNELLSKLSTRPWQLELVFKELMNKLFDVPDDAEEQAQQRPVEQIVSVATETTIQATATLDRAELDVTQQVLPRVQAKAAPKAAPMFECSLRGSTRLECERVRYQEQAKRRFKGARERSGKLCKTGSLSKKRLQRAVTCTAPAPVIEYVAPAYAVYAATAPVNEYAASAHLTAVEDVDHEALWLTLLNVV